MPRISKRLTHLVAIAALITSAAAIPGARANHGADTAGWIEQAGNGAGESKPLEGLSNFKVGSTLFNANRFPVNQGNSNPNNRIQRLNYPKFLSWGTIGSSNQLYMTGGGDDGLRWSTPAPAVIRDPSGVDVPLIIADGSSYSVAFNQYTNIPNFELYYLPDGVDRFATASDEFRETTPIHLAYSNDGIYWADDTVVEQDPDAQLITGGAAGVRRGTNGPTQVIWQAGTQPCTAGATFPWNCPYVMVYSIIGAGPTEPVGLAIAGSIGLLACCPPNAEFFSARATPILLPGAAGAWDDQAATAGYIRKVSASSYQLYYSGSKSGGASSIGVATSSDGLSFTKAASNPAAPSALIDSFAGAGSSLVGSQAIDDRSGSGHAKIFITRGGTTGSTWLAYTAPAPGAGPQIRVASPKSFTNLTGTSIEAYLNDTLGTNVGIDLLTLSITIDGNAVGGARFFNTLVGAISSVGAKVTVAGSNISVADGAHTLAISVKDLDGNLSSVTSSFTIDTTAPASILTSVPPSPQIRDVGTLLGNTVEGTATTGTAIARLRGTVINPLGQSKSWESNDPNVGFTIDQVNPKSWTWRWVPRTSLDLHFALPGTYTLIVGGIDLAGNVERQTVANTTTVFMI